MKTIQIYDSHEVVKKDIGKNVLLKTLMHDGFKEIKGIIFAVEKGMVLIKTKNGLEQFFGSEHNQSLEIKEVSE